MHHSSFFQRFNLSTKSALITGGGGLLGKEHAAALLEIGANVILTDVNEDALDKAYIRLAEEFPSASIMRAHMDVTSISSIQALSNSLQRDGKRIDILINNAAIDPKVNSDGSILESTRLENFSESQWDLQLDVGLKGAFLTSKVFGSLMAVDCMGGVIINIASDLSVIAPRQSLYKKEGLEDSQQPVKPITYSVIKSGLIGLTRYLSTYWAESGVRCNAISPGGVFNNHSDEFIAKLIDLIPMRRMARMDEYRAAIQFLCSDASSYLNGQNIVIDGGRTVW